MTSDIPAEQLAATLDQVALESLDEAHITGPPVDAVQVAHRLGLVVAMDPSMAERARFVRLGGSGGPGQGTIVVGPHQRPERFQWAVAHEIGEATAYRVFELVGLTPQGARPSAREEVANELAGRILLPRHWFTADGDSCDWDLLELKSRYSTASHELIARRMLDGDWPTRITVFDQGKLAWRRSNCGRRTDRQLEIEVRAQEQAHRLSEPIEIDSDRYRVRCWPVHEPEWRREILRTDLRDVF